MSESKYGKYIITDLMEPEEKKKIAADYAKYATRIHMECAFDDILIHP